MVRDYLKEMFEIPWVRLGAEINSVFVVWAKILKPGGIYVPPSVSLNLVVFGEKWTLGPLFVLRTAQDVALPWSGGGGKVLHFPPLPPFSLTLLYRKLRLLFGGFKGWVRNVRQSYIR